MSESVQRLRANRPLQGRECGWCGVPIDFGDPAAVCRACSAVTHEACWDRKGGCPTEDCVNRPLAKLDAPAPVSALASMQDRAGAGTGTEAGAPAETLYQPGGQVATAAAAGAETLFEPDMAGLKKKCPHCGFMIDFDSSLCGYCNMVPTADGLYRGPKRNAPGAVAALVFGILAFFICGIIFGLLAISKANEAKKAIAADPRLGGAGLATTGRVLGILALAAWAIGLVLQLSQL